MTETPSNGSGSGDVTNLEKKIVRQVEFYFGDYNLIRDTFMREKIKEDDGWFTMDVMLKFKRLSSLCSDPETILQALKTSKSGLLEIDAENQRIRRKTNRQVPKDSEEYRLQLKARTVHVNGFQSEENIDDINDFLSEYGEIEGIQLQRTQDKKFAGSLFATFFKQDEAERFIDAPMVYYKCNELTKMSRTEFYKQQDAKKKERKRKADEEKEKNMAGNNNLQGTIIMKVSGITDDTIYHTDIKEVFKSIGIETIRFFDRRESNGSEGYLVFQEEKTVDVLLQILEEKNGSKKVQIKSAEVEFSVPDDIETKQLQHEYLQARERIFNARGKKSKHGHHDRKGKQRTTPRNQGGKRTTFDSDGEESGNHGGDGSLPPSAKHAKIEK